MTQLEAIVEQWYSHLGKQFQIIAIDEDVNEVEIQYFDGNIDILSLEDWSHLDLDTIRPPANWTGPVDNIRSDDLGYQTDDLEVLGELAVETDTEERRPGPAR